MRNSRNGWFDAQSEEADQNTGLSRRGKFGAQYEVSP